MVWECKYLNWIYNIRNPIIRIKTEGKMRNAFSVLLARI